MRDLIKITTNDKGQQLVSARELHEGLKIKQDFSDWIKKQLESVDAIENDDFSRFPFKREGNNATLIEYVLTVDIAKEICMVVGVSPRTNEETRALSKQFRKYFIECEKIAKEKQYTLKEVSEEVKLEFIAFECTANLLNLNEVSKLAGAEKIYDDHGISKAALPKYVKSKGVTKSATELLKKFNAGISATKFNKLMIEKGYLKELERRSTKNPDKPKNSKI